MLVDPPKLIELKRKMKFDNKAISFHGTSGIQLGWLASQSDMLSEDWEVID